MPAILTKKKRSAAQQSPKRVHAIADPTWPLKESREEWLRQLRAEYTPEVCARTLALNDSLPIHGEP